MDKYAFEFCQKIVVFSKDETAVLLCKRKDEEDFNSIYSFIGGKMEITDTDILAGLQREKNEEVGVQFKIKICPTTSINVTFTKKSGKKMILPHYYAVHHSGEIQLTEEYSDYMWVKLKEINSFEPKIETIPAILKEMLQLKKVLKKFVII